MNEDPEETAGEEAPLVTRRRVLRVTGGVLALAVTGGVAWLSSGPRNGALRVVDAMATLDSLADVTLTSSGEWSPFRVLSHVAQSIELSMTGYRQHKSAWFKNTVGAMAYSVFRKTGRMRHALNEVIPGAPLLGVDGDVDLALERLRKSFVDFDQFEGELQPHFAYGGLTKSQYAAAHVLHMNNHLTEITANPQPVS